MSDQKIDIDRFDPRLAKLYANRENKLQQYDEWAATYEADLLNDLDYVAYKEAGDVFLDVVPNRNMRVLDVACGTGLVGQYLHSNGFVKIDGADFSTKMLDISHQRGVYQILWQHDFTQDAAVEEPYDAVICVGLFSFTVPKISHMHHVVNCVRPGGYCVITVNGAAWEQKKLEPILLSESIRHDFSIKDIIKTDYIRKEEIDARVLVIQR